MTYDDNSGKLSAATGKFETVIAVLQDCRIKSLWDIYFNGKQIEIRNSI